MYSHINTRINWFQTNQGICSKSSVSGDGETRTFTPLLVPDSNSGVSTFHHTPMNPGFIHLKETKETLTKNLQDPQSPLCDPPPKNYLLITCVWVTSGARTHDIRNHNPTLCQLSYGHHIESGMGESNSRPQHGKLV